MRLVDEAEEGKYLLSITGSLLHICPECAVSGTKKDCLCQSSCSRFNNLQMECGNLDS